MEEKYKETIKRIQPIAETFIVNNKLQYPIKDSLTLLSNMGYYIIKAKAPSNLSGFYMKKDRFPFIFVNASHSLGRQNFSLWHEVYHHYMKHQNGISDFASNSIEEREAEIFAGLVLLPDEEIKKWSEKFNIEDASTIAQMSVYYQMSFNAVVIRGMQLGEIEFNTYKTLKKLSSLEKQQQLLAIYEQNNLSTSVIQSTNNIKISSNIMSILQKNHQQNLVDSHKLNSIIEKIEVLNES